MTKAEASINSSRKKAAAPEAAEETTFSLETIYAAGSRYQPLIRILEATGRAGLSYQLNQHEKNALMQNIRDVLTHSYQKAATGRALGVTALARQAQLGRWLYLNQLPAAAQRALRSALAEFHISIHADSAATRFDTQRESRRDQADAETAS